LRQICGTVPAIARRLLARRKKIGNFLWQAVPEMLISEKLAKRLSKERILKANREHWKKNSA
jgi:hypothetical protein